MEFFSTLEQILQIGDPAKKIAHCTNFYEAFTKGEVKMEPADEPKVFESPSYAAICTIVPPTQVPRRSRLGTTEGRAVLLHAIAHIEYSAIDLALDACYRYRDLPWQFYHDWLEVAMDECRHFSMIEELLGELGYRYGDFPVHQGLFDAAMASLDLISRMAVVPRYLEANGLDANPKMIAKLERFGDDMAKRMKEALEVILAEEVEHVAKGDRWFRWACKRSGIEDMEKEYFRRVERVYPGTLGSKEGLNIEDRKRAGFSCSEIRLLAKKEVDCQ